MSTRLKHIRNRTCKLVIPKITATNNLVRKETGKTQQSKIGSYKSRIFTIKPISEGKVPEKALLLICLLNQVVLVAIEGIKNWVETKRKNEQWRKRGPLRHSIGKWSTHLICLKVENFQGWSLVERCWNWACEGVVSKRYFLKDTHGAKYIW